MPLVDNSPSDFEPRVITIRALAKHPNADALSLVDVDGNPVIVRTEDWKLGEAAVYVPVDALVPTSRPEFAFLKHGNKERHRVRAARLRGVFSMGLLVKVPKGGLAELDIQRWLSPSELRELGEETRKNNVKNGRLAKKCWMPTYGLDPFRKLKDVLVLGESVNITEKIHGSNARYVYKSGRLWVGSHRTLRGCTRHRLTEWFKRLLLRFRPGHRAHTLQNVGDIWWETAERYSLKEKLKVIPNIVCFGEIYGDGVQYLPYDSAVSATRRRFRVFDFYDIRQGKYLDVNEARMTARMLGLEMVPFVHEGPWSPELVKLAEGKSLLNADHIREGIVIKPVTERLDTRCGRVALKLVSESYLLRKEEGV